MSHKRRFMGQSKNWYFGCLKNNPFLTRIIGMAEEQSLRTRWDEAFNGHLNGWRPCTELDWFAVDHCRGNLRADSNRVVSVDYESKSGHGNGDGQSVGCCEDA